MVRGMTLREVEAAQRTQRCHVISNHGEHTTWSCPCGRHTANIPRHPNISPGVVRSTIQRMDCLQEGWLQ